MDRVRAASSVLISWIGNTVRSTGNPEYTLVAYNLLNVLLAGTLEENVEKMENQGFSVRHRPCDQVKSPCRCCTFMFQVLVSKWLVGSIMQIYNYSTWTCGTEITDQRRYG